MRGDSETYEQTPGSREICGINGPIGLIKVRSGAKLERR